MKTLRNICLLHANLRRAKHFLRLGYFDKSIKSSMSRCSANLTNNIYRGTFPAWPFASSFSLWPRWCPPRRNPDRRSRVKRSGQMAKLAATSTQKNYCPDNDARISEILITHVVTFTRGWRHELKIALDRARLRDLFGSTNFRATIITFRLSLLTV